MSLASQVGWRWSGTTSTSRPIRRSPAPAVDRQITAWARQWIQDPAVGETMEAYSEWMEHYIGYVTGQLVQERSIGTLRTLGSTAV